MFVPWEQEFNSIDTIIKLGAAIALSFFLPGYALVSSIILKDKITIEESPPSAPSLLARPKSKSLLKVLLGYILSVLITGLAGYS